MAANRAFPKAKSDNVFGQAQKPGKMFRAGLYARVSTNDQQSLPMQSRAMRGYAALGKSPLRPPLHAAPPDHHHRLLEARFFIRIVSMSLTNFSRGVSKIQCSPFSTNSNTSKLRNWRDRAISAYLSLSGRENIR